MTNLMTREETEKFNVTYGQQITKEFNSFLYSAYAFFKSVSDQCSSAFYNPLAGTPTWREHLKELTIEFYDHSTLTARIQEDDVLRMVSEGREETSQAENALEVLFGYFSIHVSDISARVSNSLGMKEFDEVSSLKPLISNFAVKIQAALEKHLSEKESVSGDYFTSSYSINIKEANDESLAQAYLFMEELTKALANLEAA